jgi:hypothetical protein
MGEPCRSDLERRQRAWANRTALRMTNDAFEYRIDFMPGYDHWRKPEYGCDHGRHGMEMVWLVIGPLGAVQWKVVALDWMPGAVDEMGIARGAHSGDLGAIYSADLGYHSPKPLSEYQAEWGRDDCDLLPGGVCFYDGSGLNAGPILAEFLAHGPHAVWAALTAYYREVFVTSEVSADA